MLMIQVLPVWTQVKHVSKCRKITGPILICHLCLSVNLMKTLLPLPRCVTTSSPQERKEIRTRKTWFWSQLVAGERGWTRSCRSAEKSIVFGNKKQLHESGVVLYILPNILIFKPQYSQAPLKPSVFSEGIPLCIVPPEPCPGWLTHSSSAHMSYEAVQ